MSKHPTLVARKPGTATARFVLASTLADVNIPCINAAINNHRASHSIPRPCAKNKQRSARTRSILLHDDILGVGGDTSAIFLLGRCPGLVRSRTWRDYCLLQTTRTKAVLFGKVVRATLGLGSTVFGGGFRLLSGWLVWDKGAWMNSLSLCRPD